MLVHAVAGSICRRLIRHAAAVTCAGDGTHLESGCYSHGHKTCDCPRSQRCHHPRRYTDPGALNGRDSYRSRWVVGRMLYTLIEIDTGCGLPLWLTLGPGNRHHSLSGALAVDAACRRLRRDRSRPTPRAVRFGA